MAEQKDGADDIPDADLKVRYMYICVCLIETCNMDYYSFIYFRSYYSVILPLESQNYLKDI